MGRDEGERDGERWMREGWGEMEERGLGRDGGERDGERWRREGWGEMERRGMGRDGGERVGERQGGKSVLTGREERGMGKGREEEEEGGEERWEAVVRKE